MFSVINMTQNELLSAFLPSLAASHPDSRLLITLDGPCASGKTTLASAMAEVLGAAVLHTDEFVVPIAAKTPERLAVPGGNCDMERLLQEALLPWKAGETPLFRRYDCRADRFLPPEPLSADRVILEGSYCNLPDLRALSDCCLFMDTPEETRLARLRARETPESYQRFLSLWIPLEKAYFRAFRLPDENCILIRDL